ncbi:MAG: hypothetical protein NWE93_00195 [Candidatus Bathyarchaeota archaeon]|nr:hypothetical protein [Candidatus Bathyarchaeota archaeon]
MFRDEHIEALIGLGLTSKQARIYLSLAKLGQANAQTIAYASKIARQDIYTAMPILERKGLVEKMITQPITFRATELKTGLSILLENRKKEDERIHQSMDALLDNFNSISLHTAEEADDSPQFSITNEVTLLSSTLQRLFDSAESRVDVSVPFVFPEILEAFEGPLERGVKIRFLTTKPVANSAMLQLMLKRYNRLLEAKCLSNVEWGMHIFDGKQVTFALERKVPVPSLWSNNWRLVEILEQYFEEKWSSAEALKPTRKGDAAAGNLLTV